MKTLFVGQRNCKLVICYFEEKHVIYARTTQGLFAKLFIFACLFVRRFNQLSSLDGVCAVRAFCNPSFSTNTDDVKSVHIVLTDDGKPCFGHCTCTVGLRKDCAHVGALFAPAGFRPRGRNPRRHPKVPRVIRKYRIVVLVGMRKFLDLKQLGAHGAPG